MSLNIFLDGIADEFSGKEFTTKDLMDFVSTNKNSTGILEKDIDLFDVNSIRSKNDDSNKKRENIILLLSNNTNPYPQNVKWVDLNNKIIDYINELKPENTYNYTVIKKGGRGKSFDFIIEYCDIDCKVIHEDYIEFKANVSELKQCPQFVSPMKPSQYFDCDVTYEEYYYDNYLGQICDRLGIDKPEKSIYLKQIHSPSPKCVKDIQIAYYMGSSGSSKFTGLDKDIENYKFMTKCMIDSIDDFLTNNNLNIDKMNTYLINTQKNKKYMLWDKNKFNLEIVNIDNYNINNVINIKNNNCIVCKTNSGNNIKILLRWKNGNGVAYPAFQIS